MRTRTKSLGTGLRVSTHTFASSLSTPLFCFASVYDVLSRKVLLQAGYILEPDCNTRGNHIRDSSRQFYDGKYKNNLFSSVGDWFNAMGEDPTNKRFGEDWARLTKDLLFDSEGSLKFKPELWSDIRKVIVPRSLTRSALRFLHVVFHIKLLTSNIFRSAIFPSPVSILSSRILRCPDAISSPTSCPSKHTISSNFRPILLLPTSTTSDAFFGVNPRKEMVLMSGSK
jgi:Family of unknown function (DUF5923)